MVRARARDLERFQSMLPVGGATSLSSWLHLRLTNFNSRSPRGERQESTQIRYFHPYFNPRSPRGERLGARSSVSAPSLFQSTLSVGRATTSCRRPCASCGNFNPRSPRGERQERPDGFVIPIDFNPRSPRGERRRTDGARPCLEAFQSTLSEGRATTNRYHHRRIQHNFNPRSPRGERHDQNAKDT